MLPPFLCDLFQVTEATLLIASYINLIIRDEGICCKAARVDNFVQDLETTVA
jgi:hypothetical protein